MAVRRAGAGPQADLGGAGRQSGRTHSNAGRADGLSRRDHRPYLACRITAKLSRRFSAQRSASAQIVGVGFTTPAVASTLPSTI